MGKMPVSKHILYEAAVQATEVDIKLFRRVFKRVFKRDPLRMREDFCGTALLARDWCACSDEHEAVGVDLDASVLDWGRTHRFHERVEYLEADATTASPAPVDVACALNFSYQLFRERQELLRYFRNVFRGMKDEGIFFVDSYAGPASQKVLEEKRDISSGKDEAGKRYPDFTYYWEQASFNFIDNRTVCHIHFKPKGGSKAKKVFTYDWRLYSIPELTDLLTEAGFVDIECHIEGWDDDADETDGVLRPRKVFEDMDAFIAYISAVKRPAGTTGA